MNCFPPGYTTLAGPIGVILAGQFGISEPLLLKNNSGGINYFSLLASPYTYTTYFAIADIGEIINITYINMNTYSGGKLPSQPGPFNQLYMPSAYVWDRWRALEYQIAVAVPSFNVAYNRKNVSYNLRIVSNLMFCCFFCLFFL